jgi:hypothetical protein
MRTAPVRCSVLAALALTACGSEGPGGSGASGAGGEQATSGTTSVTASSGTTSTGASTSASTTGGGGSGGDCSALSADVVHLFERISSPGASNTMHACGGGCDLAALESTDAYYAHVALAGWARLAPCGAAPPHVQPSPFTSPYIEATATLVLSIDQFFWSACEPTLQQDASTFLDAVRMETLAAPIVVGNVPDAMVGCTGHNDVLAQAFAQVAGASLVDLDGPYAAVIAGSVTYDGAPVDVEQLVPDGLHLSPLGHRIVGDLMIEHLNARYPGLSLAPAGDIAF